jgi:4-hydroxybenzoate polyprenyltransferase
MGVLSLIPLNASYVAGFSNWKYGLAVLCLLPVSILLAKKFSVT